SAGVAAGVGAGIFGDVEPVRRAREIKVTVRIERAHKAPRMRVEIRLDLKLRAERIFLALFGIEADAAEAATPFDRGTVRNHAQLAREAHAGFGIVVVVVVAFVPVRIEADGFALQRSDRDRELPL